MPWFKFLFADIPLVVLVVVMPIVLALPVVTPMFHLAPLLFHLAPPRVFAFARKGKERIAPGHHGGVTGGGI